MENNTYRILSKVDSPADVKRLTMDELRVLCEEIRQYMIECCSVNPGHFLIPKLVRSFTLPNNLWVWTD